MLKGKKVHGLNVAGIKSSEMKCCRDKKFRDQMLQG
jgi:hypothetical protein